MKIIHFMLKKEKCMIGILTFKKERWSQLCANTFSWIHLFESKLSHEEVLMIKWVSNVTTLINVSAQSNMNGMYVKHALKNWKGNKKKKKYIHFRAQNALFYPFKLNSFLHFFSVTLAKNWFLIFEPLSFAGTCCRFLKV